VTTSAVGQGPIQAKTSLVLQGLGLIQAILL